MDVMAKTCKACGVTKEAIQGVWVLKHGKPTGGICLVCSRVRKLEAQRKHMKNPVNKAKQNAKSREICQSLVTLTTGEVVTYTAARSRKFLADPINREKHNAKCAAYQMRRYKSSAWFRFCMKIRKETNHLVKDLAKGKGTNKACLKLFGADRETCLKHFNAQLASRNWSWQDYLNGGIEIDHRVPLSAAMSDTELRTLALLPNVQLLTADENRIKAISDKALAA